MSVEVSDRPAAHTPIEQVVWRAFEIPTDDVALVPDPELPGHGLSLREHEAERFEL